MTGAYKLHPTKNYTNVFERKQQQQQQQQNNIKWDCKNRDTCLSAFVINTKSHQTQVGTSHGDNLRTIGVRPQNSSFAPIRPVDVIVEHGDTERMDYPAFLDGDLTARSNTILVRQQVDELDFIGFGVTPVDATWCKVVRDTVWISDVRFN